MRIVSDHLIPLIDEFFQDEVLIKKPGQAINRKDLLDADILWVRTLTPVIPELLEGTKISFVGSATAGIDHIQTDWLDKQGIGWAYAPGSNAVAVAEYVDCCIAALQNLGILTGKSLRAGVIGVGYVGSEVAKHLLRQGYSVLLNDPPRQIRESDFKSTDLKNFKDLDLVCIHTSLTTTGEFPSYHLLDDDFFLQLKPGTVVINAARGAIIDTEVLMRQSRLHLCLDVWENEPNIFLPLLAKALIATPHIAGYSIDAKRRASLMLYQKTREYFGWKKPLPVFPNEDKVEYRSILELYDPIAHTAAMRELLKEPAENVGKAFLVFRNSYLWRKSFSQ